MLHKVKYLILSLVFCLSCSSQSVINNYSDLEKAIGEILFEKGYISQNDFNSDKGFSIYGMHNKKINRKHLRIGIYGVSTGTHSPVSFFIYDNNSVKFLDINSQKDFLESLSIMVNYCNEKRYCDEIITDYISRIINVYYRTNRKKQVDNRCRFRKIVTKSTYNLNKFKFEIVNELKKSDKISSIDFFRDDPENLLIEKVGIYYGVPKDKKNLEIGIYKYYIIYEDNIKEGYVILDEGGFDLLDFSNSKEQINAIKDIILFGEDHNICYEESIMLIERIRKELSENSCFDSLKKNLP